jgi:hypothetical protein
MAPALLIAATASVVQRLLGRVEWACTSSMSKTYLLQPWGKFLMLTMLLTCQPL